MTIEGVRKVTNSVTYYLNGPQQVYIYVIIVADSVTPYSAF